MPMKDFFGFPFLPINASAHGHIVDNMIVYVHMLMIPLFIGWGIYFVYVLYRFRAKRNPQACYTGVTSKASKYVEVGVILFEVVLLFGFSIPLWDVLATTFPSDQEHVEVGIVAEQFAWSFHYPGADGTFGARDSALIDVQSNPLGIDRANDPAAADDFVTKELHIPIDLPVIAHVTSKDVIHSLGIPVMRVKQDAIPGMSVPVTFTPILEGKYLIACSQLCGVGHATMRGFIKVESRAEYDTWLTAQREAAAASSEEEDAW
jgi:cytochrome c oxidase subunit II